MGSLYLILGVSLALASLFGGLFIWATRSGQWDDLTTPAERILTEDLDEQYATRRD